MNNVSYYGPNDTAVDTSLTKIGKWNSEEIHSLCKGEFS